LGAALTLDDGPVLSFCAFSLETSASTLGAGDLTPEEVAFVAARDTAVAVGLTALPAVEAAFVEDGGLSVLLVRLDPPAISTLRIGDGLVLVEGSFFAVDTVEPCVCRGFVSGRASSCTLPFPRPNA